ncbi:sensor domain-containing diguanylate cyclase [Pseudothauera nasutitermitis]|uniref:Sensor domain-containing diguanylate cyclase n=1 Tax=Pseudothauera nasutitermitis TaxID=2565930 RepID=A0A4S4B1F8_9RHOO|nr:sensor domain-containing diguanylate cyclase [Pseudothauera nasutitermitis]THF66289.1 sensor domain-containing diguanylate cyclase [Pseudothauera nasutitermitis]
MKLSISTLEQMFSQDHRLRVFNDTVPAGILVISVEDGRMVFSNRFFNEILDVNAVDILGHRWRELFVDPEERNQLLQGFAERGEVRNFELRLRGRDGSEIWGLASLSEIPIEEEGLLLFAFVDITAQKEAEAELRALADHDALTGLLTVRRFRHEIEKARTRAERDSSRFAVLFIDLDRFKTVNDGMGHEAGDLVLQEVARRLQRSVRTADTIARVGGDEFLVLAERITAELVERIAARIVADLGKAFVLPHGSAHIGASVGIALYPDNGLDPHTLIRAADLAMYAIKHTGRNTTAFSRR